MNKITQLLSQVAGGDALTAGQLFPHVYDELRKLASAKLAHEKPGQTLEATALVHEAYLRIAGDKPDREFAGRGQFFAMAAEVMRRILVDRARRKRRVKHGGEHARQRFIEDAIKAPKLDDDILELDAALEKLQEEKPRQAELVKLRYFVGLRISESAKILDISEATADRDWAYARAWLYQQIAGSRPNSHQLPAEKPP